MPVRKIKMDKKNLLLSISLALNVTLGIISTPAVGEFILRKTPLDGTYANTILPAMRTEQGKLILPDVTDTVTIDGENVRVVSKVDGVTSSESNGKIIERLGSTIQVAYEGGRKSESMHLPTRWTWDKPFAGARTFVRLN